MTSYFDEHNCQPLRQGERPDSMAHLARLLVDTGYWNQEEFSGFFANRPPPPASKKFLETLQSPEASTFEFQCAICLKDAEPSEESVILPCRHKFHRVCIFKWLEKTGTCPVCRHEFPTDDPEYEEMKRQRKRQEQRESDIRSLHDSMFG